MQVLTCYMLLLATAALSLTHVSGVVQVAQAQKKVLKIQKDLETLLRTQMKKYPALQPYARKPYTTIIVRMLVATPFIIFLGPILGLIGRLGKHL